MAEKKAMLADLKARNTTRYEQDKAKWELEYTMRMVYITRN